MEITKETFINHTIILKLTGPEREKLVQEFNETAHTMGFLTVYLMRKLLENSD